MPDMDGRALFREVRARCRQLPFICLSGHLSESEASAGGFSAFVRKPFDIQRLETVARIIRTA